MCYHAATGTAQHSATHHDDDFSDSSVFPADRSSWIGSGWGGAELLIPRLDKDVAECHRGHLFLAQSRNNYRDHGGSLAKITQVVEPAGEVVAVEHAEV